MRIRYLLYMGTSLFILLVTASWSDAAWYDSGWKYRKSHVINAASGAGTNYQVKITAHYGGGTDNGADVYLGNHSRTDFGDIRFTGSDGTTLLDYWMESRTDSDNAIFWVEVADDLSSVNRTIYVYYGKSDATTTSNGDNTFLFFDDFSGASVDSNKWVNSGCVVSNGVLQVDPGDYVKSANSFSFSATPYVIRQKTRITGATGYKDSIYLWPIWDSNNSIVYRYSDILNALALRLIDNGVQELSDVTATGGDETFNVWHICDLKVSKTNLKTWFDNELKHNINVSIDYFSALYMRIIAGGDCLAGEADWILVRKFVDPEPAHGAWGGEEGAPHSTYKTKVGNAAAWAWKIVYSTDAVNTVPSGTPSDWTWRTWEPGSGRKVPQGTADNWTWGAE